MSSACAYIKPIRGNKCIRTQSNLLHSNLMSLMTWHKIVLDYVLGSDVYTEHSKGSDGFGNAYMVGLLNVYNLMKQFCIYIHTSI